MENDEHCVYVCVCVWGGGGGGGGEAQISAWHRTNRKDREREADPLDLEISCKQVNEIHKQVNKQKNRDIERIYKQVNEIHKQVKKQTKQIWRKFTNRCMKFTNR